ncbi:MAG: NfeD family protein [Planctomycetota bacterium]
MQLTEPGISKRSSRYKLASRVPQLGLVVVWLFFAIATIANPALGQDLDSTKKDRLDSYQNPAVIEFHGPIDPILHRYFQSRVAQAKKAGADLLILEIDSPGGLLDASLDMADRMREIEWAHTVAFVPDEAISGAAIVSLGCDEIIVDDDANFGDIGAIWADPNVQAFRYAPEKIVSYLVSEANIIAQAKGRSPVVVEAMIDKDVSVYYRENLDGELEFKRVQIGNDEPPGEPWKLIEESREGKFLTLTGARAAQLDVADAIAGDLDELSAVLNFDSTKVRRFHPTATDTVVYYLNTNIVTGLLIVIGLIALYVEFSAPGIGAGGLISGLCAVLFFWSRFLGGTSGWLEVLLFLAGIIFLAMELFVIPGWGISGLMGLLLMFVSVMMASQDFVLPQTGRQWNQVVSTVLMFLCSGLIFMICAVFITRKFGRLPVFGRMILSPEVVAEKDSRPEQLDENGKPVPFDHPLVSVGDWGRAESMLRPAGRAKFGGRSLDVISDGGMIEPGCQVRVIKIQGNVITVMEIEEDDSLAKTTYPTDTTAG